MVSVTALRVDRVRVVVGFISQAAAEVPVVTTACVRPGPHAFADLTWTAPTRRDRRIRERNGEP